jgi:hypothetical protein
MSLIINHNMMSENAAQNLNTAYSSLSSGKAVTGASDNAMANTGGKSNSTASPNQTVPESGSGQLVNTTDHSTAGAGTGLITQSAAQGLAKVNQYDNTKTGPGSSMGYASAPSGTPSGASTPGMSSGAGKPSGTGANLGTMSPLNQSSTR